MWTGTPRFQRTEALLCGRQLATMGLRATAGLESCADTSCNWNRDFVAVISGGLGKGGVRRERPMGFTLCAKTMKSFPHIRQSHCEIKVAEPYSRGFIVVFFLNACDMDLGRLSMEGFMRCRGRSWRVKKAMRLDISTEFDC